MLSTLEKYMLRLGLHKLFWLNTAAALLFSILFRLPIDFTKFAIVIYLHLTTCIEHQTVYCVLHSSRMMGCSTWIIWCIHIVWCEWKSQREFDFEYIYASESVDSRDEIEIINYLQLHMYHVRCLIREFCTQLSVHVLHIDTRFVWTFHCCRCGSRSTSSNFLLMEKQCLSFWLVNRQITKLLVSL